MTKLKLTKPQQLILAALLIAAALVLGQLSPVAGIGNMFMLAAALVSGAPIFVKALRALRYKIVGIDALVGIAVIGAVAIGEFWEAAAVTFLFAFGDYLEVRSLEKTRSSIRSLLDLAPVRARVLQGGKEVEVPAEDVLVGDLVVVRPGERLAVDGVVVEGYAAVGQAAITGEALPVEALVGSQVYSGSILESGYLLVRAQRVGEQTSFSRILHIVEEAQDRKAKTQKFMERFSRYYTPAIIVLAILVYAISSDLYLALTLLVIACPGALVISTPVSIVTGIGTAARRGILVKGGETLEALGTLRAIALDKTGTLTEGQPRVVEVLPLADLSSKQLSKIAASGESYSEHPLASAIVSHAREILELGELPKPENSKLMPGLGLSFTVEGQDYLLGNRRLFSEHGQALSKAAEQALSGQEALGRTAVLLGTESRVLGVIAIADTLREGSLSIAAKLRLQGIRHLAMLTGDNGRTAKAVADGLELDAIYHDCMPEDKVRVLQHIAGRYGRVAMVGDGINDAPALASADVGVALGGVGSDIAMETADVVLLSSKIESLATAIALSRATVRNMKQNIVFSLLVAGLLLVGVLVKTVNLSFGMLVHEVSVLLVILNALRLMRFGRPSTMKKPSKKLSKQQTGKKLARAAAKEA